MSYSMYRSLRRDSMMRRRYIDAGARAVRHCDGLKEIAASIKQKCKQLVEYCKRIGVGGVIVRVLIALASAVVGVFAARKTIDVIKSSDTVLKLAMKLDGLLHTRDLMNKVNALGAKGKAFFQGLKVVQKISEFFANRAARKASKAAVSERESELASEPMGI